MQTVRYDGSDPGLDYLIANSGVIGRQILRIGRFLYFLKDAMQERAGAERRRAAVLLLTPARGLGSVIIFLFVYYIGGSLTRADQLTLARLNGLGPAKSHRLTMINALLFGIPCAALYFAVGEGLRWVGGLHSLTAVPSWVACHSSQLGGLISLAVDLFRAVDSAWNKRCWAPFGMFPFLINLPTYLKKLVVYLRTTGSRKAQPAGTAAPPG